MLNLSADTLRNRIVERIVAVINAVYPSAGKKLGDELENVRVHNELGTKSLKRELDFILKEHDDAFEALGEWTLPEVLEEALKDNSLRKKLITKLQDHNINVIDGDLGNGNFSLVADVGENQILHMSFPSHSYKNHRRFNEPEILQPLVTLYDGRDLKIEILPKVKTQGVTDEHITSLVSSLAKKGLLFVDAKEDNVGLMEVGGKEIPVVIGDGAVTKIDGRTIRSFEKHGKVNDDLTLGLFNWSTNRIYSQLSGQQVSFNDRGINVLIMADFFKKNQNYIKYDWGEREKPETWAQNKYIEKLGLKKDDGSGRYYPKGIIDHDTLSQLNEQKSADYPIAGKYVDMVTDHNLREQDARKVAALEIADIVNERGGDKAGFIKFLDEHKKNTRKQR